MIRFLPHFPYSLQPGHQPVEAISETGAPGQAVTLSFSMRSEREVTELVIETSALEGPRARIEAENIDCRVVRVWEQAGLGIYKSAPLLVPELLLKDDRESLDDAWVRKRKSLRGLSRPPAHYYEPPHVRLRGPVRTFLVPGAAKQIWITVRVPEGATAGSYVGSIRVRAAELEAALELRLEVLPLRLEAPGQDLMLWYRGRLDWRAPRYYVPPATFLAQLREIRSHGFNSVSLTETRPELLRKAVRLAEEAGFRRILVLESVDPAVAPRKAFASTEPVFYLSDEADVRGRTAATSHLWNWRRARQQGARTLASLVDGTRDSVFRPGKLDYSPDLLMLYLPRNLARLRSRAAADTRVWYYWQSHMEKPTLHRLLMGIFLWASGARGAAPYCFQHMPEPPGSPFLDFGTWERPGPGEPPSKQHMTTYPAREGSIPTIQWMGIREGIDDLRYLTTLDAALGAADTREDPGVRALASAARARVAAFMECLRLEEMEITSDTEREPLPGIGPQEYQDFRVRVGRDAAALQAALDQP